MLSEGAGVLYSSVASQDIESYEGRNEDLCFRREQKYAHQVRKYIISLLNFYIIMFS